MDIVDKNFRTNFPVDINFGAGVMTIATRPAFVQSKEKGESLFYEVDSHPTDSGHRLIADILYDAILNNYQLPVADKLGNTVSPVAKMPR